MVYTAVRRVVLSGGASARGTTNALVLCVFLLCWRASPSRVPTMLRARRDLYSNQLSGSLPSSLGSLTNALVLCVFLLCWRASPLDRCVAAQFRLTRVPTILRA